MPNPENLKPFKKGKDERRNENGRPKDELREIKTVIADLLKQQKNNQQLVDGLMTVVVNKALKGDLKAVDMLLSYCYGKPTQRTEITGADGEKIDFKVEVLQGEKTLPYKPE
jgi:hypothetical protein